MPAHLDHPKTLWKNLIFWKFISPRALLSWIAIWKKCNTINPPPVGLNIQCNLCIPFMFLASACFFELPLSPSSFSLFYQENFLSSVFHFILETEWQWKTFYDDRKLKIMIKDLQLSFRIQLQSRQTYKWWFYTAWQFKTKGANYENLHLLSW